MTRGGRAMMPYDPASESATPVNYTALRLPIILGSLALATLSFLLPIYAKRLGADAVGIGGLFAVAQGVMILLRPGLGWALDRHGRKGFFIAGMACYAGAMGVFVLASNLTVLYLAQLLHGMASACLWTSAYTITTDLATPAQQGKALGRIDEYAYRGALYGLIFAFALLSWFALHTAWRMLFLSYMALAALGAWLAWTRAPETRPAPSPQSGQHAGVAWQFMTVMLVVLLSSLLTAMIRPVFLVFLQDELTQDVRLLALAFLPATLAEGFLPSRLGHLSDRWSRRPLIIVGLTWAGLSSLLVPVFSHPVWVIIWWTLKTCGLAAAMPPQKALISDLTTYTQRGTGYGLYTFAASLGAAIGPLLGGWMYDAVGHAAPFLLTGAVLLASPVWVPLLLRRR